MVDYGPQTPMNTTTVATAVQRRCACHTRTVLPADAYGGSVVTSCSLHVLSTCGICPGLCARERATKPDKRLPVRTYVQNRPHTEKTGKSSYPLPPEKKLRTPRELQCSDRAQTLTTGSGRPSYVDVLSVLAKIART